MTRPGFLAALVAGAVALGLLYYVSSGGRRSASTIADAGESAGPAGGDLDPAVASAREPVAVPDAPLDSGVGTAPAEAPVSPPIERTEPAEGRPRIPADYFERMYAKQPLEELVTAKALVELEYFRSQQEAIDARLEAGLYETVFRKKAATLEESEPIRFPKDGLIHGEQTQAAPDGSLETKLITLPYDEHVHVYDKQDELFWLIHEIKKVQSGQ